MSRRILILALALVVGFAWAAYAEVQNVKVSGDFTAVGAIRNNLLFQRQNADADAWVSITRVKIDANLTDNVDFTVRLLNERAWGGATITPAVTDTNSNEVDVAQAFVTMKDFMKDTVGFPWTAVVGRQAIKLGSGLLIGAAGTNRQNNTQLPVGLGDLSKRSSFDGIANVMDFDPLTVTAAYVKAAEGSIAEGKDTNVYALQAAYKLGEKDTILEATYVLSAKRDDNVNNFGGRVTSKPIENLGVEAEYVYQTAARDYTAASTWLDDSHKFKASDAIRLAASYAFPDVEWKPTVGVDFTRLSSKWNPMHEDQTPADLANLLFANTNVRCIGASVAAKPKDDLTLKFRFADFAAAKKLVTTALPSYDGTNNYLMVVGKKALGREYDLGLAYDYTEDVQLGLSLGLFKPGKAFDSSNRKSATQVIGSMKVTF